MCRPLFLYVNIYFCFIFLANAKKKRNPISLSPLLIRRTIKNLFKLSTQLSYSSLLFWPPSYLYIYFFPLRLRGPTKIFQVCQAPPPPFFFLPDPHIYIYKYPKIQELYIFFYRAPPHFFFRWRPHTPRPYCKYGRAAPKSSCLVRRRRVR